MLQDFRQRYGQLAGFWLVTLICLSLFRIGLLSINFSRVEPELVPGLLLYGLRFDLIVLAYLLFPPLVLSALTLASNGRALSKILRAYYRIVFVVLMAMEAIGIGFLAEYDHRPDTLFWEYLKYPSEVSKMLFHGFGAEILGTLIAVLLAWIVATRLFVRKDIRLDHAVRLPGLAARLVVFFFATLVLAVSVRSSLGHRPANVSTALFSDNRLANELALNSTYTAGYALYARKNDTDNSALYGSMDFKQAIDLVFDSLQPGDIARGDPNIPTLHRVEPTQAAQRPRNVVIILEESLGARFVGALGGADLTPNFDRLSESGVLFTNLYATGTRTTRGIEAVVSGFPPSASQSVVKRSKSRHDFFTLAQLLREHGYRNYFLYGGEANFDDMGSFMLGNGFDEVIAGAAEYPDAQFVGSWGVSDEDWVRRAHRQFEEAHEQGPFFGLMLSTSNHTPWEFPTGRIEPGPGPIASRENSIRYADYALGQFFELAQASDYYKDTIFLVVADHDSRVYGDEFVPIDYFHIPGLLIGAGLAPSRYERIASQIDLLPTMLPLLGIPVEVPTIGQDLFSPDLEGPGRAMMQYGMNNALMVGNDVLVRLPNTPAKQFRRDAGGLQPTAIDPELEALSLAYLTIAGGLYEQQSYRVPDLTSGVVAVPGRVADRAR